MSNKTGPGHPPKKSQYKKGKSGNPDGRPPKKKPAKSTSAFDIIIDQTLTITRNGMEQEISIQEARQHKAYLDAISGNVRAAREIVRMINKREKARAAIEQRKPKFIPLTIEPVDPDNANEAMKNLVIATPDERWSEPGEVHNHIQLEPWAVQLAISRPGGSKFTDKDKDDIQRCTRDHSTLKWPKDRDQ